MTVAVIAIAAIIAWCQLCLLRKQIKAQHDWNRRLISLRYSFSADPHIREIRTNIDRHLHIFNKKTQEISLKEIIDLSKEKYPSIMSDIQFILGRLENMCVGIKNGIVDEQTCKDMLCGTTKDYFRFFRQYIENTREERKNPKLYIWLEIYAKKWEKTAPDERLVADHKI